jgi:YegS/Rv2252/BmrU family lipid kinase
MKVLFLVNERSGVRRSYDVRTVIRAHWRDERCDIQGCSSKEELDRIIDDASRTGVEAIFAVGGDGTVHEIGRRLIGKSLALGIVPTGSGNGFARHLRLPMKPADLVRAIPSLERQTIDTAEVNERPFIGVMGVGFDAHIADRFESSKVRGIRTYIREGLTAYSTYRPHRYELTIDGAARPVEAYIIAVANSSQYGNNARIAPGASVTDGKLNVVVIRDAPLMAVPIMMMRLFAGSIDHSAFVTTIEAREVVIRRENSGPAHVDGEPLELPAELHVRIRPASLNVLVPKTARI